MTAYGGAAPGDPAGGGTVRDDRAWPRWAGAFSLAMVAGALAALAWALATASRGPAGLVVDAVGFAVVLALAVWIFGGAFTAMVDGHPQPRWAAPVQLVLVLGSFAALAYDARLGAALLAGLFGGMFTMNLLARRRARGNRAAVDAAEARLDERRAAPERTAAHDRSRTDGPALDVGSVLDGAWRDALQRCLAWLVAGAAVWTATWLLTDSGLARFMVAFAAAAAVLWTGRAAASTALARRDFRLARTPPQRAWVVLLHDPAPRMVRPLLGVWAEEPVIREGRFPKPDLVFRCDDELDDLLCLQGSVRVHEAWVDTSARGMRGARWVAADEGVALPHRRAVLGRAFFSAYTRAERPDEAQPLTTSAPAPDAPAGRSAVVAVEDTGPGLGVRLAWRVAGLAVLAGACVVLE